MKNLKQYSVAIAAMFYANVASALDYDITDDTDGGGGAFAELTAFIQNFISFVDGPVALLVSIVSILGFAISYALNPREGSMGIAGRTAIASIIVLNITTWISAFIG